MLAKGGLPPRRLYELRHWFARLLLNAGAPLCVVSEAMGHAGVQVTKDVYGHISPDAQRAAVNRLAPLFPDVPDRASLAKWPSKTRTEPRAGPIWRAAARSLDGRATGLEGWHARRDSNPRPLVPKARSRHLVRLDWNRCGPLQTCQRLPFVRSRRTWSNQNRSKTRANPWGVFAGSFSGDQISWRVSVSVCSRHCSAGFART